MTQQNEQEKPSAIAERVASVRSFDPGIGAYAFDNLGEVVKFADLMSKGGEMLPAHLRNRPALCLAVTMRAVQWGFDPFALAQETYQAQSGGVIGYQGKVFPAALHQCAGIQLRYRYEGKVTRLEEPAKSAKGNQVAARKAVGDRKCIAYVEMDGEVLEYETPTLDEITIKNSPLWHNDPDQQLAYYAARGWTRRHRPGVIMGAFSSDEVAGMPPMRDVTPKKTGFARMALEAKERERTGADKADEPVPDDDTPADEAEGAPEAAEAPDEADDAETVDAEVEERSDEYVAGRQAALEGFIARKQCPFPEDAEKAADWFAGFDSVEGHE
jgi:hypothetical protein